MFIIMLASYRWFKGRRHSGMIRRPARGVPAVRGAVEVADAVTVLRRIVLGELSRLLVRRLLRLGIPLVVHSSVVGLLVVN